MKNQQLELWAEPEPPAPASEMIEMMALNVQQPHASNIATGDKTLEYRSWATPYRGSLLIVASKKPRVPGLPSGQAVGIVQLVACQRGQDGRWQWMLANARQVKPFFVQGRLGLYRVQVPAAWLPLKLPVEALPEHTTFASSC